MDKLINNKKLAQKFIKQWRFLFNRFKINKRNSGNVLPENWALSYQVFSSLGETVILNKPLYNKKHRITDYLMLDANNPSFEKLTGLDGSSCIGNKASQIYNLNTVPFIKEIEECFKERKPISFETYFSAIDKHVAVAIHLLDNNHFVTVLTDISERKNREIELSSSQRLLDSIICQSPDVIYRLDKMGRISFISNAVNNYGYKPQDLIGKPILDLVHPDDREKAQYKVNERRTGERSTKTLEIRLLTLKKDIIPFETILVDVEKTPCFTVDAEGQYYGANPDGTKFVGTQGIMRDVTHRKIALNLLKTTNDELEKKVKYRTEQLEKALDKLVFENATRKQQEEELRKAKAELEKKVTARSTELVAVNKKLDQQLEVYQQSETELYEKDNQLQLALDAANICTWIWNAKTNTINWLYNAEKIFNVKSTELPSNLDQLLKFVHPEDILKLNFKIKRVIKSSPEKTSIEFRIINKKGEIRWFEAEAKIYSRESTDGVSYLGTIIDISEQKRTNSLLQEAESRYRTLFEQSPNAVILIDPKTLSPIEYNDKSYKMFGYTKRNFKKVSFKDLYVKPERMKEHLQQAEILGEYKSSQSLKTRSGEIKDVLISTKNIEFFGRQVLLNIIVNVTKYKQYQRELQKISNVTKQTTDNVIITNKKGIIEYVNPAFENFTGYSNKEMYGQTTKILKSGKHDNAFYRNMWKTISSGKTYQGEICNKKKNGELYYEETTITPLRDKEGNITHFVSTAKEITKSKQDAESLRKFSNVVKQMGDSVIITNNKGIIEFVNSSFEEMTGYKQKEVTGKNPSILKSGLHDLDFYKQLWAKILNGNVHRSVFINRDKNGNIFYEEKTISPLKNSEGELTHFISTGKDITQRIEVEKSLKASEDSYKALYHNNPSMVFQITAKGKILSVNKFGASKLGYKVNELIKTSVKNLYHSDDRDIVADLLSKCIKSPQKVFNIELRKLDKQGKVVWVAETLQAVHNKEGELIIFVVCNDVTEQKLAEKEKEELHSQLLQIQKMDAVGTLAGGIAHDFNNMLTVINGHAEVGLATINKDQPAHRHLISILKAGKRAENLTRQLLAFSRKQIFEAEILNINNVIIDLDKMMRRLIGEDIKIQTILKEEIPLIKGEAGQIEQVLMNLLVNARDAINEHTEIASEKKITIETESSYMDETYVSKYVGLTKGEYVVIAVSDTGVGIEKKIQEKIFEPFFTTKKVGQGTGLGLATVYGIVKQNDAYIYVYSEPGKGSTFKIYWPVTKAAKKDKEIKLNDKIEVTGNEIVLLVEDDDNVRDFASSALKQFGYTVHEASNGKEALQLLDRVKVKPNLLITDMVMPEMNGKELVSKVEELLPQIKVIFTSGYTDNYIVQQGELMEGIHFLQKPFSVRSFMEKIRQVLETDDLLV